jgi:hypothetical protein
MKFGTVKAHFHNYKFYFNVVLFDEAFKYGDDAIF